MRKRPIEKAIDALLDAEKDLCKHIANTPRLLNAVLSEVRSQGRADHRFDVNLAEGKVSEELVKELLNGNKKVEVKRQYRVGETKHVLIEYAHNGGTKKTGISTTESDWYALVLDGEAYEGEVIIFITTERLKRVMRAFGKSNKFSGRKGYSNFKLIPLQELITTDSEIRQCSPKRRAPVKERRSTV